MKFGLFYQVPVPKPLDAESWAPGQEERFFQEALEQIELADRLGFDYVFAGEHHSAGEYCHISCPDVFLAAVAARTSRIRLGTSITQVMPDHQHPARVAERFSMVDVLSHGRVELGSGTGQVFDLDTFWPGAEAAFERGIVHDMWHECLQEALKMMAFSPYEGFNGQYVKVPPIDLVPKPVQKPHPPLWYATTKPDSAVRSAELGMGVLANTFLGPDELRDRIEAYWKVMDEGKLAPIGEAINPAMGVFTYGLCAPTDEAARERDRSGLDYFAQALARGRRTHEHVHFNREFHHQLERGNFDTPLRPVNMGLCVLLGSPATVAERIREFEQTNADLLVIHQQIGDRRHEDIMESLELLATKVFPEFRDRQVAHDAWREVHLEPLRDNYTINSTV